MNDRPTIFSPWLYFSFFLISNIFLSYASLAVPVKLTFLLAGILAPFAFGCWDSLRHRTPYSSAIQAMSPFTPHLIFWLFFVAFIFLTRFYRLTSLPFWLVNDEGNYGTFAINTYKKWNWALLQGEPRIEAVFSWLCALIFRWIPPSFFSLRLIPGLLSLITGFIAYAAGRKYFPAAWAFIFAWLCSFSFWAYTLSRLFMPTILPPLLELAVFGTLAGFLFSTTQVQRWFFFLLTVLISCLGLYAAITFPVIWLSVAFILGMECFYKKRFDKLFFFLFLILTVLLVWPMVLARLSAGGMAHIQDSWGGLFPLKSDLDYMKVLFWDGRVSYPFGSDWGGLFNPLLLSLVFVGFLYMLRIFDFYVLFCSMVVFILSLLSGLLSRSIELYRVSPSFILFMAAATWGIFSLMPSKNKMNGLVLIILFLSVSSALDIYNFIYCYSDIRRSPPGQQWRSVEYFNAYQTLRNLSEKTGPIDFFNEWNPDYFNKTLSVASYSFNALENPAIDQNHVLWAAFLIDVDFAPFLKKRFPHVEWRLLNPDLSDHDLHHLLGLFLVPVSDIPPADLKNWLAAQRECDHLAFLVQDRNPIIPWSSFEKDFAQLADHYSSDPFLASVLWEKAAFCPLLDGNFQSAASDFQQAIRAGYPVPHLKHNWKLAYSLSKQTSQNIKKTE
jgi:hypothetical protein